jgi:hypothetical protein
MSPASRRLEDAADSEGQGEVKHGREGYERTLRHLDREQPFCFTNDAFDAIAEVLGARGVDLPPQQQDKSAGARPRSGAAPIEVVVSDIQMPFWSMVTFMIKWGIASIPAVIILTVLAFVVLALLQGLH